MDDNYLAIVGRKATVGVLTLIGRTAVLQLIAVVATFLLTILLDPEVYGIFFIVSAIVAFLNYFSDIGLAAALIQKKEHLTAEDLETTFTIQQLVVFTTVIISMILSPWFASLYRLNGDGLLLLQALIIAFFLSSLKTIPSILLERDLEFNKLIIPQVVETIFFYGSAILFAYLGWGISSFTIAVFLRGLSGLVVMYLIRPWRPRFGIQKSPAKRLLTYGIPFQLNSVLALIKDDLFIVFLGSILSFREIGFIGWAKKWAEMPLRLFMDNIIRVTFPAYSRLQHDTIALTKAVEKALFYLILFITPLVLEMIVLVHPIMVFIPQYSKWEPAILSFYFFALGVVLSAISSPLVNALNAIGKIRITLRLMLLWTILTWTLIPLFVHFWGFVGVALGILVISTTVIIVISIARKYIPFSLVRSTAKPLILSLGLGLFLFTILRFVSQTSTLLQILALGFGGLIFYSILLLFFARSEINSLIQVVFHERS